MLAHACRTVASPDAFAPHPCERAHPVRDDVPVTDLVTRARNGDKQAWDALVERYAPLIWSICRRYRLGREQVLIGRPGLLVGHGLGVERVPGRVRPAGRADQARALPAGGGGEPSGQRGWLADRAQVVHQAQPDALADVVGVGAAEPVLTADRPDQRGVPLDQGIPRALVAASGPGHQVGGPRVIMRRAGAGLRGPPRAIGCHSGHDLVLLSNTGHYSAGRM